jgi:hypothetical protein
MRGFPLALVLAAALVGGARGQNPPRNAESSTAATGLLMGVVIDPAGGQAVANAEVALGGAPGTVRNTKVLTDAEGRFVFLDLPKGTYTITAAKAGYAEGAYGRRRAGGLLQPITLGDAERLADLRVPLWKFGVIAGRVLDEAGEPLVGIVVRAMQRTVVAGRFKLTPGPQTRTDDWGRYRLPSLTPGDYAIVVPATQASAPQSVLDFYRVRLTGANTPEASDFLRGVSFSGASDLLNMIERHGGVRAGNVMFLSRGGGALAGTAPLSADGRMHVYPTQYYPAAPTPAEATIVALRSGEERASVDLQLKLVPASRVSGTVTGPNGPALSVLSLAPDSDDLSTEISFETATTMSDAAGRFEFVGVPEGRYRLRALWALVPAGGGGSRGAPPPAPTGAKPPPAPPLSSLGGYTLWATRAVTVGAEDVANLAVTLQMGHRIGGRTEFGGSAAQPPPEAIRRISVTFDPADARPLVSPTMGRGQVDETGRLSSYQLPPGRYFVRVSNAPAGWNLKAATVNGQDVSNVALTLDRDVADVIISFSDRTGSLAGQVRDAAGAPDVTATVLVFPASSAGWSDHGSFPRRLHAIRVDRLAQFSSGALPPGDYLVVAVPDEASANWQDPAVLKSLARVATSVAVGEGLPQTVALRTTAVPR